MWADDANDRRPPTIRHQNDSLFVSARELGIRDDSPFVFLCECRDDLCTEYVKLTIAEYAVRREAGAVLAPGHLARAKGEAA
jgi:hypothetical protein